MTSLKCPDCGARFEFDGKENKCKCNYCGCEMLAEESKEDKEKKVILDAKNFMKQCEIYTDTMHIFSNEALIEETSRMNIIQIWDYIRTYRNAEFYGIDKEVSKREFYTSQRTKIIELVEAFEKYDNSVKEELGEVVCSVMENIINYRNYNGLIYLDQLEDVVNYRKELTYQLNGSGLFDGKKKKVIKAKLLKLEAREAILYYDAAITTIKAINRKYDAEKESIEKEYNSTSKSAKPRRKELKLQLDTIEVNRKAEIDSLNLKERNKVFNKYSKKLKIQHKVPFEVE